VPTQTEARLAALEARIECLNLLVVSLMSANQNQASLRFAIERALRLHDANAVYQMRLSDEQIDRVGVMLQDYIGTLVSEREAAAPVE